MWCADGTVVVQWVCILYYRTMGSAVTMTLIDMDTITVLLDKRDHIGYGVPWVGCVQAVVQVVSPGGPPCSLLPTRPPPPNHHTPTVLMALVSVGILFIAYTVIE